MSATVGRAIELFLGGAGAAYATAEGANGRCKEAAFAFAALCEELSIAATVLNLSTPVPGTIDFEKAHRFWYPHLKDGTVIHYAVRVAEIVVDFTARQFDPEAPLPLMLSLEELRARWRSCYDTSLPLTAAPLWRDW